MTERDDFLTGTLARQIEAETAIHNGDLTLAIMTNDASRASPAVSAVRPPL